MIVAALCWAGVFTASAQTEAGAAADLTVITSDKLTFDYAQRFALFDGNVVVVDPQMKLYADKMTVVFSASNRISEIKAEGKVYIVQDDKRARSEVAQYNVDQGIIVMTGKPQVTRGEDILTGDKITFWRNENKMLVEPRARLVINPQDGQARQLMGDPRGQ
jgi:lipopolysaccharide export system protein LptA